MTDITTGTAGGPFGQRIPRKEDARLLTGRGRYVADVRLPDQVHVAFVRSPLAHARIVSVDVTAALALDGVLTVATGADPDFADLALRATSALPNHVETPQPALAADKVRYQGQEVAAVIATDPYVARDAADLVMVDYDPLDPIVTDHLGDVYWAVGRDLEADFQWRRALSFEPEDELAERIRRKLEVGLDQVLIEEGADPIRVADGDG